MNEITLQKIDRNNLMQALRLKVKDEQKHLVPDIKHSMCLAYVSFANRIWVPYVICQGEQLLGAVTLSVGESDFSQVTVSGFFIADEHQGKGLGTMAVDSIIQIVADTWKDASEVALLVHPDNHPAKQLYEKKNFVSTGKRFGAEELYTYKMMRKT